MTEGAKVMTSIFALLVLCGATYVLVKRNESKVVSPAARYESALYGYSFAYDPAYVLTEYGADRQTVGTAGGEVDLVDVTVLSSGEVPPEIGFDVFAQSSSTVFCASSGAQGSTSCTGTSRSEHFTTAAGVTGEVFYLVFERVSDMSTTTREAGPFYAFELAPAEGGGYTALVIRPSRFYEESAEYDAGAGLANAVANSLEVK